MSSLVRRALLGAVIVAATVPVGTAAANAPDASRATAAATDSSGTRTAPRQSTTLQRERLVRHGSSRRRHGPRGRRGPRGAPGARGIQGLRGPAGAPGAKGDPGVAPATEAFREVSATSAPSLSSNWVNDAPLTSTTVGFYRDASGRVHLKGVLRQTGASTSAVFRLPAGYVPARTWLLAGVTTTGTVRSVTIAPNGDVTPGAGAASSTVSLDGLSFRVGA